MIIYLCVAGTQYEGEETEGIYTSRKKAQNHSFSCGDDFYIDKWRINKKGIGKLVERFSAYEKPKQRKRSSRGRKRIDENARS